MYAQNTESVGTIYGIFSFFWYATLGYFTAPEKHFMLRERVISAYNKNES
jgi:hypothetical protein